MPTLLLFGASGAIGGAIREYFVRDGWSVVAVGRPRGRKSGLQATIDIEYDALKSGNGSAFKPFAPFDAVCWAQGMNLNDSIHAFDRNQHVALYEANCLSIALSLSMLLNEGYLAKPARLCVISSIWQNITRQNKFSYSVTKAALKGLVLSAAADLARDGHLINAVLPGVLETPMTRANLSEAQIRYFEHATLFGSLAGLEEVAYAVWSLVSPRNGGITGQFIKVDRGYSDVRIV